jgi:GNAT superfamily N-acetyltransferase
VETVRPAVQDDLEACARLLTEALAAVADQRGGAALTGGKTPEGLLARWTATEAVQLFVGQFDDAVVGLLAVAGPGGPDAGSAGNGRRGMIECCYVEPEARGVGVGSALTEAAVSWCAERGCQEIDALALPGDRSTKQRLEAAGFTARLLTLSRRLG